MLLKQADCRAADIAALEALAKRPGVDSATRKAIELEKRKLLSGVKGEKDAAYHLDFSFGSSKNSVLIHDLRLEHQGRVAQIDHLLINRLLDVWLFESKRFVTGIGINEYGECSAFYGGRAVGIPSPFEQNERHIDVLKSVFRDKAVTLPSRLGFDIRPSYLPRVLVSSNARISRPKVKRAETAMIVKADQVRSLVDRDYTDSTNASGLRAVAKIVSRETLYDFGARLVAAHRPASFDWAARFGLSDVPVAPRIATTPPMQPSVPSAPATQSTCAACDTSVSQKVVDYCAENQKRFAGHVFCYKCQRDRARRQAVMQIAAE